MHTTNTVSKNQWPNDVGILAIEIYLPRTCVSQTALGIQILIFFFYNLTFSSYDDV